MKIIIGGLVSFTVGFISGAYVIAAWEWIQVVKHGSFLMEYDNDKKPMVHVGEERII